MCCDFVRSKDFDFDQIVSVQEMLAVKDGPNSSINELHLAAGDGLDCT